MRRQTSAAASKKDQKVFETLQLLWNVTPAPHLTWIQRAAASMISDASVKLVALEPVHEGVYEVTMDIEGTRVLGFDKIVVLDSTSSKNLTVHFIS